MSSPPGRLVIVATPIGNLGDISARAIETLRGADVIACEDTRHTKKLLSAHGIERPTFSLHEHNEEARVAEVRRRIEAGECVALVSDAGTPLISDPGYRLVRACREVGLEVSHIPGPCAAIAAVVLSGLPTDELHFVGFLPDKAARRREALATWSGAVGTLIAYESPNRLLATLGDIEHVFADPPTAVARELTKIHEELVSGRASEVRRTFEARGAVKGECVIVVDTRGTERRGMPDEALSRLLQSLVQSGASASAAVKQVVEWTGEPKNRVYALSLRLPEDEL